MQIIALKHFRVFTLHSLLIFICKVSYLGICTGIYCCTILDSPFKIESL